ncbi:MAG: TA system VapC family ribonuclease toxin [Tetrasphaera sp.]
MTRLLDVNVLLALMWDQHVHHRAARAAYRQLETFATTPLTESGFLRLLLTPAVVGRTVSISQALAAVSALRNEDGWRWVPDEASFVDARVDVRVLAGRRQVTDLHLVDLAARHACLLATFDAALPTWLAPADRRHVEVWKP